MKGNLRRTAARREWFRIATGILSEMGFVLLLALGGFVLCLLFSFL
jgi:hypothetical protein